MSTEQRDGPQIPQLLPNTADLYKILRQRLKHVSIHMLRTPPKPYEHNDDAHQSKETLNQWATNVGADRGVLEILDTIGGHLKDEIYNFLWELHDVMEDIEVQVGSRPIRSDRKPSKPGAFKYFNSLLYTFNSERKLTKFSDLADSHAHYQVISTPTPPPSDLRDRNDRFNGSYIPSSARSEEKDRVEDEASNQSHLRNDSHSYIKKEEPSPMQRDYFAMSSPTLSYDSRLNRSGPRVKVEDTQTDYHGRTNPTPFTPSVSMSPNISDPAPTFSPTGSSPNAMEPWSPQTPISSTLPYPSSSIEERKRAHAVWESTTIHRDEQPVVMHTRIPLDPPFPAVPHLPSVSDHFPPILPPPEESSLALTPPRSGFYQYHRLSSSSSPPTRRSDS